MLCLRADSLTLYSSVKSAKFEADSGETGTSRLRTGDNPECQEGQECEVGGCAAPERNGQTSHSSHSATGEESAAVRTPFDTMAF